MSKPPYNALAVANFFIDRAKERGVKLDLMKLQMLIYNAHGWHLALYGKPLIDEEVNCVDWTYKQHNPPTRRTK